MSAVREIAFFNAFYIKSSNSSKKWHIEESRIKGGFNNTFMDLGVRAFVIDEEYASERRKNALIYSGIFNSKTGINNLNQFSIGDNITKAVDIANGSIQKLYAEDTNLIILQEDKVNRAPVDKDFIFTAEGSPLATTSNLFIGQILPYSGKYGIGTNPESFAVKGNRKYFTDNKRGVVLRLSGGVGGGDGLTEVSFYGMRDWFKDNLKTATKLVGMYDNVKDQYILHIEDETAPTNYTLGFDESASGWTSFYTFYPEAGCTLNGVFYTFKNSNIYKHYSTTNYNSFYGTQQPSKVELIMNNQTSMIKVFNTLNYEGTSGWSAENIKTETDNYNISTNQYDDYTDQAFNIYKYVDTITAVGNTSGSSTTVTLTTKELDIFADSKVFGNNIPNGTIVTSVNNNGATTVLVLSNAITASSLSLTFKHDYDGIGGSIFAKKQNKYYSVLINNSPIDENDILFGEEISGIKGAYASATLKTDTSVSDKKELFAVSSEIAQSSN